MQQDTGGARQHGGILVERSFCSRSSSSTSTRSGTSGRAAKLRYDRAPMRRRAAVFAAIGILLVLAGLALALRAENPGALLWRARLASLVHDRDSDVRNNLLRDRGDPFALRRRLLAAPAAGADRDAWRAFVSAAAAPRPDYDAIERTVAALDPALLPRGAADAYRYLQLWSFWQRNRVGSAAVTLERLVGSGHPAARAAARLGEAAGPGATVQLVLPGPVRSASAGSAAPRFRLRRLLALATRRLAIDGVLELEAAPAARTEILALSAAGQEFARLALLPGGETEVVTARATVRAPGPWRTAGRHRLRLLWDGPAEEVLVELAGEPELRAPGALAPLEPPAEIELRFTAAAAATLRDVVVAASPRGATVESD